jgi:hypothetical protein
MAAANMTGCDMAVMISSAGPILFSQKSFDWLSAFCQIDMAF